MIDDIGSGGEPAGEHAAPSSMPGGALHTDRTTFDARAALEALGDGYVALGSDGRVLFANDVFVRLTNAEDEPLVGRVLWDTVPAFADAGIRDQLRATLEDGGRRAAVVRLAEAGVCEVQLAPLARGGASALVRARPLDDAGRRSLEEQLEENASLRELARALAAEVDLDELLGLICREAMAQCRADGATVGQIEGEAMHVVAGAGTGIAALGARFPLPGTLTARAIAARVPTRSDDYRAEFPGMLHTIPGFAPASALSAPLVANDAVLGVLLVARSGTRRPFTAREERRVRAIADHAALAVWKTNLLEEVQSADRAKNDFLATISHELRTPLTALTGYQELLSDEVFGPLSEPQRGALDRMRLSTELLTAIIDEVLSFSRLEAGEERARPQATSVAEVVDATAAVLEPLSRDKRLAFLVRMPEVPVKLVTDPDLVRRVLVNLGANAIKFTAAGTIALEVTTSDDAVRFAVRDTGIGIAAVDLPRLFRPFVQLETGFTRRYGGTGLGLYISQRMADLLGGSVEVESVVGEGSTFTLIIPREAWAGAD